MSPTRDIIRYIRPGLRHRIEDAEVVISGQRGSHADGKRLAWAILADLEPTDDDQTRIKILARLSVHPSTSSEIAAYLRLGDAEVAGCLGGLQRAGHIVRMGKRSSGFATTPTGSRELGRALLDQFGEDVSDVPARRPLDRR